MMTLRTTPYRTDFQVCIHTSASPLDKPGVGAGGSGGDTNHYNNSG